MPPDPRVEALAAIVERLRKTPTTGVNIQNIVPSELDLEPSRASTPNRTSDDGPSGRTVTPYRRREVPEPEPLYAGALARIRGLRGGRVHPRPESAPLPTPWRDWARVYGAAALGVVLVLMSPVLVVHFVYAIVR